MIHNICAIRDNAIQAYGRPFFAPALGGAIRSFTDEVNNASGDNNLYTHSDDFDLYDMGRYDDNTGEIIPLFPPLLLLRGKDAKLTKND
jgi:hypothetical protein